MLRHILLFVLVMVMVKTNAQQMPYYYLNGAPFQLYESNDKMAIQLTDPADGASKAALFDKISDDPDFERISEGHMGYIVVKRKPGSTITKANAISNYINEANVAYVSFAFDDGTTTGNSFWAMGNDLIVRANDGLTQSQVRSMALSYGLLSIRQLDRSMNIYHLFFPKTGNTLQIANSLYLSGSFRWTEPNFFYAMPQNGGPQSYSDIDCMIPTPTNDVAFLTRKLWGLYNDGSNSWYTGQYGGTAFVDINICHAWRLSTGSAPGTNIFGNGTIVAVVDDGVDVQHPDLINNAVAGYDATPPGSTPSMYPSIPGTPDNMSVHGTHCAGIILAERNNPNPIFTPPPSWDMVGAAPNAKVMPIRSGYFDWMTGGYFNSTGATLGYGIKWAVDHGADVINCSWSYGQPPTPLSQFISDAIDYATQWGRGGNALTGTPGKGCLVVFSAGNENKSTINWPASHPKVIGVGAMNMCDTRKRSSSNPANVNPGVLTDPNGVSCDQEDWWGSNYGTGAGFSTGDQYTGRYLSVVAPGVKIFTTQHSPNYKPEFNGTSAAAPHVAGVAALMLEANPCMEWHEVRDVIEISATKTNTSLYTYSATTGIYNGLWNSEMGYGRLNAGDAVTLSYDLYKQRMVEDNVTKIYRSSHHIYAGRDVSHVIGSGKYIVGGFLPSNTRITFWAPPGNAIHLEPGFEVNKNAYFNAEIVSSICDNNHNHYKQGNNEDDDNSLVDLTKHNDNAFDVSIYPNPVESQLNVSFSLATGNDAAMVVNNIVGQTMMELPVEHLNAGKHIRTINTSNLTPGVYLIGIKTTTGYQQFKFVKQ